MRSEQYSSDTNHTNSAFRKLFLGCFAAAVLLVMTAGAPALAQDAPAGPQSAATPSDQPSQTNSASSPAQNGSKPNLSGTWNLNKDQSDNPQQKMQEAGGFGGRGGGMGGGGGMGMGRRNRGGGGMMNQVSQLTITQTGSNVKITTEDGRVLAVYPSAGTGNSNGNESNGDDSNGRENRASRTAAQWQDSGLVVQMQGRRGGTTTRTFELSPDGKQLYMIMKIDNPRFQQPVTIRFVYDPAKTGE
jgi:hypothetical protein